VVIGVCLGAACSSTPSISASSSRGLSPASPPHEIVLSNSTVGLTSVHVGDLVEVDLTSQSFNRDGSIVPWSTPTSTDPAILAVTKSRVGGGCPAGSTCTFFTASHPGDATVLSVGPSGMLCNSQGSDCVAVTAETRQFHVRVAP